MLPKITEVGRLWAPPEIRFTSSGKAVCELPIVFSKRKKTDAGGWVDDGSLFVKGSLWGQYGENAANSFEKGDQVIVTGELYEEEWQTKEGEKRKTLKMRVYEIGPAIKWAPVIISRPDRSSSNSTDDDPWATSGSVIEQDEDIPF